MLGAFYATRPGYRNGLLYSIWQPHGAQCQRFKCKYDRQRWEKYKICERSHLTMHQTIELSDGYWTFKLLSGKVENYFPPLSFTLIITVIKCLFWTLILMPIAAWWSTTQSVYAPNIQQITAGLQCNYQAAKKQRIRRHAHLTVNRKV